MIKKIITVLLVITLMCPTFKVNAATQIRVENDGSFLKFAKKTLVIKETKRKKDKIYYYDGTLKNYDYEGVDVFYCVFKSSNRKVATVSSDGVVHAKKKGTAYIKATIFDEGDYGNQIKIGTIKNKVIVKSYTKLKYKKISLFVRDKWRVKVTGNRKRCKKWKSSNKRVATVTKSGRVKAKRKGATTISCLIAGKRRKMRVKVMNPTMIDGFFLVEGHSSNISILGHSGWGKYFKSLTPSKLKVSPYGKVKGLRPGTARVRCKSDGVWIKGKIYVEANKCTFSKVYKSMSNLYYGQVETNVRALYFSGNKLMVKTEILNKRSSTLKKMSYFKVKIYKKNRKGKKKRLFTGVIHNGVANVKPFRKKNVRWCLSTKKKWKKKLNFVYDRISIQWEHYK